MVIALAAAIFVGDRTTASHSLAGAAALAWTASYDFLLAFFSNHTLFVDLQYATFYTIIPGRQQSVAEHFQIQTEAKKKPRWNFENRSAFGKVTGNVCGVLFFFDSQFTTHQ